ncbi:MAG: AAA family ATPase [Tepidisphaeraceae bacterium]
MLLSQRLAEYVRAAFTGIWVESHEHEDALAEVAQLCEREQWSWATWDVDRGLQIGGKAEAAASDPVAAVRSVSALAQQHDGAALLVLPNFHRFLASAEVMQAVAHQVAAGKQNRTFLIVLAPLVQVPLELEKQFVVIEHELPDRTQLQEIAAGIATEPGEVPEGDDLRKLLDAASGLTRHEAEGAFSLSIVREGRLAPATIWELKSSALKKGGLLGLHRGGETFANLGGLEALKGFCLKALARANSRARARGVLLLGVPGTGKSAFAKALGNETGRPTLTLDVGALMGSLLGQTEQNVRHALRVADAMSPCVLFVDEIEKALAGAASSGTTDSGVSARLFGALLTWLSDHTSDVFFIGTSNDVSRLPPEFARAERFDGIFFLDLPSAEQRHAIWPIYLDRYGLSHTLERPPADGDWTGAEIASCCRLAALLDLTLIEAAEHVVPVAVTAAEQVQKLRGWASGRCLDASRGGIYSTATTAGGEPKAARRVSRVHAG